MACVTLSQKFKEVVAPEPQACLLVGQQVEGRVGTSLLELETPVPDWFRKDGHHGWPMECICICQLENLSQNSRQEPQLWSTWSSSRAEGTLVPLVCHSR